MPLVLPPDLTVPQTALWLDQQLFPGRPIYTTGQVLAIEGDLRADLFEAALRETVAECPHLQLPPRSGTPLFDLTRLDFRSERDPLAAAEQWMRVEMRQAIAIDAPALFHFALIRTSDDHTLWFQKYHHIIIDATGRRLLSARVAARYRAVRFGEPLPVLDAYTPSEVLEGERRYTESNAHETDREYWVKRFANWPGPLLETSRQNTERAKSGVHARIEFTFKRADFTRMEEGARASGSTAFRAIIALIYTAFARLYDRSDLVFGVELAHRSDAKARQVIGLMARPLPMEIAIDRNTSIADAMRHIDDLRAQNYPHRNFPIQELVRELGIVRKGQHGLFDVIVNYIPSAYDFSFEDSPIGLKTLSNGFPAPWLVTITDPGLARDLDVTIDTDPGLISPEMAARLASYVENLLLHGLDNPDCPLAQLPIMPEVERAQVQALAEGDNVALPKDQTLTTLCAAQAERTPDAVALICAGEELSYAMLHRRAERLARRLAALGVKPGVIVGIALPRAPALVIAVLAVHKAGGAYLALDPAYPAERLRFYISDTATPVIITTAELAPAFADSGAHLLIDGAADVDVKDVELIPARPDDLAYVLYTSGSTGKPKAVGIEHRNLINLVSWGRSVVSDDELRGLLFSTSLNFDLSAFEMFVPLVFGGSIVLVENVLALQVAPHRDKVRLINTGPSLFDALLRADALPPSVSTVILAGEKLPRRLASILHETAPGVRLLNCYGPTETTVYSTWATIDPAEKSEPTIGRAIWNTSLHVLDNARGLVPRGVEGELYIGGAGVSCGYLGRPELTAERFIDNPFGEGKLYRTGDRVRWRADGELDLFGRADDQIKINGIRIEPGEIEAALLAQPGIAAGVVTLYKDTGGVRRLAAYLVRKSESAISTDDVRAALERQLPRNMVPSTFIWLDAMPMTPNGKLDRKALPAPQREQTQRPANRPPQTKLEREIAAIWEELLRVSPIGVQSDFYDVGGDSLALLSLFASIEASFGRRLTVDVLSGGLTIGGLAQILESDTPLSAENDPIVTLQPLGSLPPFFCVHGVAGDLYHLHRLSTHMGTDRPFLGIRRAPNSNFADTLNEMASRYVAAMLVHQPTGPYYLGGHSFGATVAYEIAVQLEELGHDVGLLAILDQRRPAWRLTWGNAIPALPRILMNLPARIRAEVGTSPQHFAQTLRRWSKAAVGQDIGAATMFNIPGNEIDLKRLFESNIRAVRAYQPRRLRAPVLLIRSKQQLLSHLALDDTLGWSDFVDGGIKVRTVPGNHHTMATEPLVRELADVLCDELNMAQQQRQLRAAAE